MSAAIRRWLLGGLLPFWAERAWNSEHGGYVAQLSLTGEPLPEEMRSCLVQARCLYSFSHGAVLSGETWALAAARRAHDVLLARFRRADGLFVAAADPRAGGPRDERADFYDQAFVLFGLAWWHRASGEPAALGLAHATWNSLDRLLADRIHGGFREDSAGRLPRRQNPHMHLLEALHALFEASGDPLWLARAEAIVDLFLERLHDGAGATVREFLAADLSPARGEHGSLREPGHALEWVWLLAHHHHLAGDPRVLAPARALYAAARRTGVDASGHVVETTTAEGRVSDPAHLLWPQTEAVKAALAMHEFAAGSLAEAEAFLAVVWRVHMPGRGPLWINRLRPDGAPLTDIVPTRLLYHLVLCLAEYLRVTEAAGIGQDATHEPEGLLRMR